MGIIIVVVIMIMIIVIIINIVHIKFLRRTICDIR